MSGNVVRSYSVIVLQFGTKRSRIIWSLQEKYQVSVECEPQTQRPAYMKIIWLVVFDANPKKTCWMQHAVADGTITMAHYYCESLVLFVLNCRTRAPEYWNCDINAYSWHACVRQFVVVRFFDEDDSVIGRVCATICALCLSSTFACLHLVVCWAQNASQCTALHLLRLPFLCQANLFCDNFFCLLDADIDQHSLASSTASQPDPICAVECRTILSAMLWFSSFETETRSDCSHSPIRTIRFIACYHIWRFCVASGY